MEKIKQYIKLSNFIKDEALSPFIVGAFLSRLMAETDNGKHYFYAYSSYRASKKIHYNEFDFEGYVDTYIEKLNYLSGYKNWSVKSISEGKITVCFYVLNDMEDIGFDERRFYSFLNQRARSFEPETNEITNDARMFIRGFLELRGSIDTTARYLATDFFSGDDYVLKRALMLSDLMNIPQEYQNFNPRDVQPQYVSGENKRNPQLRINLFYYASNIGFINDYKGKIFERSYSADIHGKKEEWPITYYYVDVRKKDRTYENLTFIKRIQFFSNYHYGHEMKPKDIEDLRSKMGFKAISGEPIGQTSTTSRNKMIREIFDISSEDKCVICGTTKTYPRSKNSDKQYFEIHHVIPFKNGDTDNIANLVKLCPTCHSSLGRGRASREEQIKNNKKILENSPEVYDYASVYYATNDIDEITKLIVEDIDSSD